MREHRITPDHAAPSGYAALERLLDYDIAVAEEHDVVTAVLKACEETYGRSLLSTPDPRSIVTGNAHRRI
jgi:hypothetical protein